MMWKSPGHAGSVGFGAKDHLGRFGSQFGWSFVVEMPLTHRYCSTRYVEDSLEQAVAETLLKDYPSPAPTPAEIESADCVSTSTYL